MRLTTIDRRNRLPLVAKRHMLLIVIAIAVAVFAGLIAGLEPFIALPLVLFIIVAPAMILWPDVATLVVIFLVYSNVVVVAVRFHGVPYAAGAALRARP